MAATNAKSPQTIKVREKKVILVHWFNALCWFLLIGSGLGIISGDAVRLAPAFWPEFLQGLFRGNGNLVFTHAVVGLLWIGVLAVFIVLNLRRVVIPFLREVLVLTPAAALRDGWFMVVTIAHLFGLMKNAVVPPQGRYNGAQRLLGTLIVVASVAIALSGLYLFFAPKALDFTAVPLYGALFRWSLAIHAAAVFLVLIGLVAHIYFAVIEERESLESMKSGYISVDFIRHHSPLWHQELEREGRLRGGQEG